MNQIMISVFTPTYNRASLISRVYESLKRQTYKNFEWIIVDDESSDNTEDVIESIISKESEMKITFLTQTHGGKHRAVNKGLELARGKLFFIVDSDDYILDNALERIVYWEDTIRNSKSKFAGICCLSGYNENKIIGNTFEGKYLDIFLNETFNNGISGDRPNILYTDVFKKYKYPEIEGEWHIAPGVPFVRMAKNGYKLRYFNEILYIAEYLEDGLTKLGDRKIIENFQGYTLRTKEWLELKLPIKRRLEMIGKYSFIGKKIGLSYDEISQRIAQNKLLVIILAKLAKIKVK
ncbi:glycosyltransferase family 2 protein [Ruoffia sp. FAM 20858]|uniref:glycosyltransferase family 2 protein n=1 Tax=Ruoffia sp. FAM 20858 TaxID=3259516 RepID=UPI00388AFE4C